MSETTANNVLANQAATNAAINNQNLPVDTSDQTNSVFVNSEPLSVDANQHDTISDDEATNLIHQTLREEFKKLGHDVGHDVKAIAETIALKLKNLK